MNTEFYRPIPILPVPGRVLLVLLQRASWIGRRLFGSGLGAARVVDRLAPVFPSWKQCPIEGPDGLELRVDIRNGTFGTIVAGFGNSELNVVSELLGKDAVVLDVGANVGYWARDFARNARVVYAFEPSPFLQENISFNAARVPNIVFEAVAVGEAAGAVRFLAQPASLLGHINTSSDAGVVVQVISIDGWVQSREISRIDLLKVDVEGLEEEVLFGAASTILKHKPLLMLEFIDHLATQRSKYKGRRMFPLLAEWGYEVYRIDKSGVPHRLNSQDADWTNDYIAAHRATNHFALLQKHAR